MTEEVKQAKEQRRKQTCLDRYGVDNAARLDTTKEKIINTYAERYGADYLAESAKRMRERAAAAGYAKVYEKTKQTCLGRYGVEHSGQIKEHRDKRRETFFKSRGTPVQQCYEDGDYFTECLKKHGPYRLSEIIGVNYTTIRGLYETHDVSGFRMPSKPEAMIREMLDGVDYEVNNRSILGNREIDLFVPSRRLGIEVNGLYCHSISSKDTHTTVKGDPNYHREKYQRCRDEGITLLQFTDQEIIERTDVVRSMIQHNLGKSRRIHARKCVVVDVTSYRATEFCNRNHIRGYVNSSIRLGLEYEGELVSLLLVSKSRFERGKHEITRFCSSLGVVIVGGLSRLIHHLKDRGVKHLITYADLRFGDGESYAKAGFTRLKDTHVGYGWVKNRTLYPRQAFQKHKLKGLFENYDESHTEDQIMFDNGYRKFYDCGNAKYQIIL